MTNDAFRFELREYLASNPSGLIDTMPSGSGIFRIANTTMNNWDPGFASTRTGRWTNGGQSSHYFANDVEACAAELGYELGNIPNGIVIENWEITCEVPALNLTRLPCRLADALFAEKGEAPNNWRNSHIFLEEIAKSPFQEITFVYAPSASGQALGTGGMCFVSRGATRSVRRLKAQSYGDWQNEISAQEQ